TPEGIRATEPEHPVNLALEGNHLECGEDRNAALVALMFEGYYRPDLRRRGQINDQFDAIVAHTANVPAIRDTATQVFASTQQLRHEAAQKAERSGQESTVWTGRRDIFGDRFTKQLFQIKEKTPLSYVDGRKRRFHQPGTIVELLKLTKQYPEARLVAGGTELGRLGDSVEYPNLISLEEVEELNTSLTTEEAWEIGAAVPLTQVTELIGRECFPFAKLLRRFASRAIRNRATLGGYLATAWSRGQITPLLMALNARVLLLSEEGERNAPISQFFDEQGETILSPGEIIRSILIPRSTESALSARGVSSALCDIYSVAPRRSLAEPYATGAFAFEFRDRIIAKARLAYSGVAEIPTRAREVEEFLTGKVYQDKTIFEALPILIDSVEVSNGEEEHAEYRKTLTATLFQKFFFQHPTPETTRPNDLSASGDFTQLDHPFFDAVTS
ncbi:MAG: FAD binding domain-containing protein, partial [Verrucomicrobiota bacterium]